MKEFGLIGGSLKHSFSKECFDRKFDELGLGDHQYCLFELENIKDLKKVITAHPDLVGLNVTTPYKENIIPYLDELSDEAKAIGAVNCIKIKNKKLIGYNTDAYGFMQSILPYVADRHRLALVLGTGGASKAVAYALNQARIDVYHVTSKNKRTDKMLLYSEIDEALMSRVGFVVNATPVGMYPNIFEYPPFPYYLFSNQHLAYDLIYNPEQTQFLKKAFENGAQCINGKSMLHLQAEKSWEIWNRD